MNLKSIVLSVFLLASSLCAFAQDKPVGVYLSADDYINGKLTDYGAYKGGSISYGASVKFEKAKIKVNEENKIWGFRAEFGYYADFRFDNKRKTFYVIRSKGPISLYTGAGVGSSSVTYNDDSTAVIGMSYAGSDIYISRGPDGELIDLSKKHVEELLADDPKLLQAFQTDKTKYNNLPFMSNMLKQLNYITVYNSRHKAAKH